MAPFSFFVAAFCFFVGKVPPGINASGISFFFVAYFSFFIAFCMRIPKKVVPTSEIAYLSSKKIILPNTL